MDKVLSLSLIENAFKVLEEQKKIYLIRGWDKAFAINIKYFINSHIDQSE